MIAAEKLAKSYGPKPVLRGLSLRAEPEEITLLVGPNGAGKSTTMKILAGLIRPNGGRVQVHGFDIVSERIKAQRSLAYLPQSPRFHPRLTCTEVLRFYARLRGASPDRCRSVLALTELSEFARVHTGALSGGTRQRLGLALLLLADAPVLLLDEPGLSLDPGWRKRLQEMLRRETQRGKTVLITTHLVAEWNSVADRCLLCRDGAIERELDPMDLPHNFEQIEHFAPSLGSARVPRAGFGVSPERIFESAHIETNGARPEKPANAGTHSLPQSRDETHALPNRRV
jgi:ABC-2 type transport system ATP-binding protein